MRWTGNSGMCVCLAPALLDMPTNSTRYGKRRSTSSILDRICTSTSNASGPSSWSMRASGRSLSTTYLPVSNANGTQVPSSLPSVVYHTLEMCDSPGWERFQGAIFHTAHWDQSYDYWGKRMAVIGNGCSAAQVVPVVVGKAKYARQYARSPEWYHERPNQFTGSGVSSMYRFGRGSYDYGDFSTMTVLL